MREANGVTFVTHLDKPLVDISRQDANSITTLRELIITAESAISMIEYGMTRPMPDGCAKRYPDCDFVIGNFAVKDLRLRYE